MSRFQKWALATTIATYILIMVGVFVRASGAGLGCPDWPQCYGRPYPPLSMNDVPADIANEFDIQLAWIEYSNRMVGVVIGFLILGTLFFAVRDHRDDKRLLYPAIASFILVLFQGWLGGQVVKQELASWLVTVHMLLALVIVTLLLYATVNAFYPDIKSFAHLPSERTHLGRVAFGVLILTLGQVGFGAKLRGELETVEENMPALARADWIHEVGVVDIVHRTYSWLILFGVLYLVYYTYRYLRHSRWLMNLARVEAGMVFLQIGAGIGLAYGGLPPALQVVHLINGSVLVGALTLSFLLVTRLPIKSVSQEKDSSPQPILSDMSSLR